MSVISIAISVLLLLSIERIRSNVKDSFSNTISGTDLIVGARTSNLSLLLSTVFHLGGSTKSISWEAHKRIKSLPQVVWTIPISLGDSHKGYPVIGSNADFFKHYKYGLSEALTTNSGDTKLSEMQCVIGSKVAEELNYYLDDDLILTHGMGSEDFSNHKEDPFQIGGILSPTGTPIDNSIFISLEALEHIHDDFYNTGEASYDVFSNVESPHDEGHDHPESITGFYIGVKDKLDIIGLQKLINDDEREPLLAIMPAVTLSELWRIMSPIENILLVISLLVLIVSLGSVLIAILASLNQRRREMAVLRSVGAQPRLIFGLIVIESTCIVLTGIFLGIFLLIVAMLIAKPLLAQNFGIIIELGQFGLSELFIVLVIFVLGVLIGVIPALRSYKRSLIDGLTIKT